MAESTTNPTPSQRLGQAWKRLRGIQPGRPEPRRRHRVPTVLQIEAVECGAASLAMVLAYYGRFVPLEEMRVACGVSRDGAKASHIVRAARDYGLKAQGFRMDPEGLSNLKLPLIAHWNLFHFLVIEGFTREHVLINDPAIGPRRVSYAEFDQSFTGVVLEFSPEPEFTKGGERRSLLAPLARRLRGSGAGLAYAVLAGLGLVIPGLVIPVLARVFVDDLLLAGRDILLPLLAGLLLTALLRGALVWLQQQYLLRLETKLAITQASRFLWQVLALPIDFFHQRFSGELATRVGINDKVAGLLSERLASTVLNIFVVAFYAILMARYSPVLTALGVSIALANLLALRFVNRARVDTNRKLLQERGKLSGTTYNGLQIIETLKATGTEDDFFARWAGFHAKTVNAEQQLGLYTQLLNVVPSLLSALNTTAILLAGSQQVVDGDLSIGELVAFQSLMVSFMQPFSDFVALGATLQETEGDMYRLDDVFRYPMPPSQEGLAKLPARLENLAKLEGRIELKDISFGYSRLEPPLISGLNLTIRPGHRVALVGASGSGKSTVAKLVAGLYRPWEGRILIDGVPREDLPQPLLINSLAMVDQEIYLFEGSVRENLTLWDATIPEIGIVRAARDAAIHDEIAIRAGGYDTRIEEGGRNFSGGQRQRLEIARALTIDPTILVLDEATSALDPTTEKEIDDNLRRRGVTCLIVAHRLSTIRDCDEIIVLERGQVVQRGSHDDMIRKEGPYARLLAAEGYEQERETTREAVLRHLIEPSGQEETESDQEEPAS